MEKYITTAEYQRFHNSIDQTKLIKELWEKWLTDTWNIHYLPEEDEADRLLTIKNVFNGDEEAYGRWEEIEHWITFEDIERYIDSEELEKRRVCFIESEFGTWIGVNHHYTDDTPKEIVDILFNYELTKEDIENLKNGKDISFE